jgi:glycine/D-amino acid oxidase-like deaminating enzyme
VSILIVGAGPVGLTMAVELARFGIPTRLIASRLAAVTGTPPNAICSGSRTEAIARPGARGKLAGVRLGFFVDTAEAGGKFRAEEKYLRCVVEPKKQCREG